MNKSSNNNSIHCIGRHSLFIQWNYLPTCSLCVCTPPLSLSVSLRHTQNYTQTHTLPKVSSTIHQSSHFLFLSLFLPSRLTLTHIKIAATCDQCRYVIPNYWLFAPNISHKECTFTLYHYFICLHSPIRSNIRYLMYQVLTCFLNGPSPASFSFIQYFQTNIFTTNKCKNVHPVYGAGIETHDLWNVSLLS